MLITDPDSPDFESYASIADMRKLALMRGYAVPEDVAECEQLLVQAMDYLEALKWKGTRSVPSQPLAWPRSCVVVDGYAMPRKSIPKQLIQAQCRLAVEAQETDLQPSFSGGGQVTQETVTGAVSVSYAEGSSTDAPSFTWLNGLLRGMVTNSSQVQVVRG